PGMARHTGVARAGRRSRAHGGLAARNSEPLVIVSRRLPGRHQQSQAAGVRRGVLPAVHRARWPMGAAVRAAGGDVHRHRGVHLLHARAECARAGALSRASGVAAASQQAERNDLRGIWLRPAALSPVTLPRTIPASIGFSYKSAWEGAMTKTI